MPMSDPLPTPIASVTAPQAPVPAPRQPVPVQSSAPAPAVPGLLYSNLTIPPASSLNAAGKPRALAAAAERSLVPVTYGTDRVAALIVNVLQADVDSPTLLVQCLWGFACHAISELLLNDAALPAGATVTHYTGGQASPDAALVTAFAAQGISYADALAGYAYSVVAMPSRAFSGQLNISARVQGRRVYDPRKDSTAGGTGSHRLANPATWEHSDNPALHLADWCASALYGAGTPVDWASVGPCADACDAQIGSPLEARRLAGHTLADAVPVPQVADALRAYAGCWLLPGPNGLRLLADMDAAPVASCSHADGNIADLRDLQRSDSGQLPTAVEVLYTDTSQTPWREAGAIASLPGAGVTRPWRLSQVRMPGVQRHSQAYREAVERLNKLALSDLSCTLEVFDIGIRHEVADIVEVTHPLGLSAALMRVVGVTMTGLGRWVLQLVQHSPAAYSTAVVAGPALARPDLQPSAGPPANVAALAGSVGQGIVTWSWAAATDTDHAETELRIGGSDWTSAAPLWAGRATGYLMRVTTAGTYVLRARHRSRAGALSPSAASATVVVTAGDLVQSEPGSPGLGVAQVHLYRWALTQPGNPSGTSTWTWDSSAHTGYTGGNSWQITKPANPGTANWQLWEVTKTISASAGTTSTTVQWDGGYTVASIAQNGAQGPAGSNGAPGVDGLPGQDGTSVAEVNIYRRAASVPATPTGGSFNFNTQVLTPPASWSVGVPAGTDPVYVSRGMAATSMPGATVTPTWGSAALAFSNGAAGTDGQAVDVIFRRAATQPATPAASAGVPPGWYSSVGDVPASSDPMWSSFGQRAAPASNWTWQVPVRVQGLDGAPAQTMRLAASALAIGVDTEGGFLPPTQTITFDAVLSNITGTAAFTAERFTSAGASLGSVTLGGSGNTGRTLTHTQFGAAARCVVQASIAGFSDAVTILRNVAGPPAEGPTGNLGNRYVGALSQVAGTTTVRAGFEFQRDGRLFQYATRWDGQLISTLVADWYAPNGATVGDAFEITGNLLAGGTATYAGAALNTVLPINAARAFEATWTGSVVFNRQLQLLYTIRRTATGQQVHSGVLTMQVELDAS